MVILEIEIIAMQKHLINEGVSDFSRMPVVLKETVLIIESIKRKIMIEINFERVKIQYSRFHPSDLLEIL
jgi:hypothetical protein